MIFHKGQISKMPMRSQLLPLASYPGQSEVFSNCHSRSFSGGKAEAEAEIGIRFLKVGGGYDMITESKGT